MQAGRTRSVPIASILMIGGGALAVVGSFLTWATVGVADVSRAAKGTDELEGWFTLIAGLMLVMIGVLVLQATRWFLAVLAFLAGVVAGGLGLYEAATAEERRLDTFAEQVAAQVGLTVGEVRTVLDDAATQGQVDVSLGPGVYLVIGGGAIGAIGAIGGLLQLFKRRRREPRAPTPAAEAPSAPPAAPPEGPSSIPPAAPPVRPEGEPPPGSPSQPSPP